MCVHRQTQTHCAHHTYFASSQNNNVVLNLNCVLTQSHRKLIHLNSLRSYITSQLQCIMLLCYYTLRLDGSHNIFFFSALLSVSQMS